MMKEPKWIDVLHKYPKGFRAKLVQRDGGCVLCGSGFRLAIHHYREHWKDGAFSAYILSMENNWDIRGFVLLCGSCHAKIHSTLDFHPNAPILKLLRELMRDRGLEELKSEEKSKSKGTENEKVK